MSRKTSWTNKFQTAYRSSAQLEKFLDWKLAGENDFPLFIPERLAFKIKAAGPGSALAKEFLIDPREENSGGFDDPIGDKKFHVAPQLIHRYPSRALFTPTSLCPVHCRYCFRRNELNAGDELFDTDFAQTLTYLNTHPQIQEVIFTGGDPFTLSTNKLAEYIEAFSSVSSLKHLRFHTRYPMFLPERFDSDLLRLLKDARSKFQTVSVAVHANHVDEFDEDVDACLRHLHETGVQMLSQTVLLKGVNDSVDCLTSLIEKFLSLPIRPYYLHHPDQVKGGLHFYLPLEEGRRLYAELRKHLPGWAIPQYIIDVPGGHGKLPAFNPEASSYSGQFLSLTGVPVVSPEPSC